LEGKTEGLPINHMTKKMIAIETAQPVTMLFVMAQPLPKSINLLALGDTPAPSPAKAMDPEKNRAVKVASLGTRSMTRKGAWEVLKGFEIGNLPLPRQPRKGCSVRIQVGFLAANGIDKLTRYSAQIGFCGAATRE
jgi:hypothetical protein